MAKVLGFQINIQGTEQSIETAEQLRRAIAEISKELKKTEDVESMRKLEEQLVDLKARQQEVNATIREEVKLRRTEMNAVDDVSGTYDNLSKTLNEQRKRYKDLAAAGKESSAEAIKLRGDINDLDKQLKKIDANVGQFQRNVGGYTEALAQFFPRVSSSIGQVTSGFQAAQGAAGGFNKALGFIGLAATIIMEVSAAFQSAKEAAKEFNEIQRGLAQTTDLATESIKVQSGNIIAIARTYEAQSGDIQRAANTLSKEFGISIADSLELIEAGFRKGANAQGDFIDQLREYPAQFAAAGGSAEEFLTILIRAQQEGIYSDKGIDAVKEFGLRIREQTTATRDALIQAFGEEFTSELFNNLNNGSITTVDALKQVSKGLQDTGLTGEQTQKVIADVFGGPGEDAGLRYLQLLGDIGDETENVTKSTNKYEEAQTVVFQSNQALAKSQALLSEVTGRASKDFTVLGNGLKTLGNVIIFGVIKFFQAQLDAIVDVGKAIKLVFTGITSGVTIVGKTLSAFFNTEGSLATKFQAAIKAGNDAVIESQKEFNKNSKANSDANVKQQQEQTKAVIDEKKKQEEAARKAAEAQIVTEEKLNAKLTQLREQRSKVQIGSADYKRLGAEIEKLEKQLSGSGKAAARTAGTAAGKEFVEGSIAAIQKEANRLRAAIDEAVAGSEAQAAIIAAYKKQEEILEQAIAARNKVEFEGQRKATLDNLNNLEQLGARTAQIGTQIVSVNQKKQGEEIQAGIKKTVDASNVILEKFDEDQEAAREKRKQELQQYIQQGVDATFGLINAITAAANQKRNEIFAREIESTEMRIANLEERANKASGIRKRLLEQQAAAERKALEEQTKRAEAEQKKQRKNEKRNAIIQSIINGALAVQRALSAPPIPNIPFAVATGIFAAIQTATIAAQPLATGGVAGISGRRVNDRQNIRTRPNGDNVLATLKRGEVVLNSAQQSALGGASTFRRIGVPGFATGGVVAPTLSAPSLPASLTKDANSMLAALDRKTDAINNRIDRLRAFVVTEDITRDIADAESVRIKAEL